VILLSIISIASFKAFIVNLPFKLAVGLLFVFSNFWRIFCASYSGKIILICSWLVQPCHFFFLQGTLNIMVGLILLALASTKLGFPFGYSERYTLVFHKIITKPHKFCKGMMCLMSMWFCFPSFKNEMKQNWKKIPH